MFIVTPRVVPLARTVISRSWAGEGEGQARLASMAGEDDVIPREYRNGDERRRVHWRSTARYGELMVRREEQRWRNRATVLLDSRSMSHLGSGAGSSFEMAVSAAASVGVHVSQEGLTGQYISDNDIIRAGPFFEDRLLDALAVVRPSNARTLDRAFKELKIVGAGVIIAVMGRMSQAEARQLAACRTEGSQGIALLLDVATWADAGRRPAPAASPAIGADATDSASADVSLAEADEDGTRGSGDRRPTSARTAELAAAAAVLRGAGWHVTTVDTETPLAIAWQRLPRAAEMLVATGTALYPGTGSGVPA
jgi:uncharacterized protein (DUF58 family)